MSKPNVLAFVGAAGCGKDTAARYVSAQHPLAYNLKFAGKLKDLTCLLFGWDRVRLDEDLEYKEAEAYWPSGEPVSTYPGGKMSRLHGKVRTRREILQLIGTDMFRRELDKDIWLHAAAGSIPEGVPLVLATDIRFDNELEFLQDRGHRTHTVRLVRENATAGTEASSHVSELGIPEDLIDAEYIIPDGDLSALQRVAEHSAEVALGR